MTDKTLRSVPAIPLTPEETAAINALPDTAELRTEVPELASKAPIAGTEQHRSDINWIDVAERVAPENRSFILKVGPAAEQTAKQLNVPVAGVIAQLALESGWGKSSLASHHNNFGGIKATPNWTGDVVEMPTYEKDRTEKINAKFRSYASPEDYMKDYAALLSKPRYANARGTNDAASFGLELTKSGYSQDDPMAYSQQLASIARRLGL